MCWLGRGDGEKRTLQFSAGFSGTERPAKVTQTPGLESSAPQLAWASFHRTTLLEGHMSILSPLQNKETGQGHLEESQRFSVHWEGRQPRQSECRDLYGQVIKMGFAGRSHYTWYQRCFSSFWQIHLFSESQFSETMSFEMVTQLFILVSPVIFNLRRKRIVTISA